MCTLINNQVRLRLTQGRYQEISTWPILMACLQRFVWWNPSSSLGFWKHFYPILEGPSILVRRLWWLVKLGQPRSIKLWKNVLKRKLPLFTYLCIIINNKDGVDDRHVLMMVDNSYSDVLWMGQDNKLWTFHPPTIFTSIKPRTTLQKVKEAVIQILSLIRLHVSKGRHLGLGIDPVPPSPLFPPPHS